MTECHNMAILTHCETVYIAQICCLSLFFFSIVEFAVIENCQQLVREPLTADNNFACFFLNQPQYYQFTECTKEIPS